MEDGRGRPFCHIRSSNDLIAPATELIIFQPVSQKKRIAVIPGDGIGPEVITQAVKVIQATGAGVELTHFDWGANRYLADGVTVPPDGFAMLERDFDAILLGCIRRSARAYEYPRQGNLAGHAFQDGSVRQRSSGAAAGCVAMPAQRGRAERH